MELAVTRRGPFGFGWIEGLGMLLNPHDWDMEGWVEFCELLASFGPATHHYTVGVNYAPGRGPTPEESRVWAQYQDQFRIHRTKRLALLTDAPATQDSQEGVNDLMTVRLEWRPFATRALDEAFAWLHEASPFDVAEGHRLFDELYARVYSSTRSR